MAAFNARMPSDVNYAFGLWRGSPVYPYWVSTMGETMRAFEDGRTRGTITLTGWTRGSLSELLTQAEAIQRAFYGYTAAGDGFSCAIDANAVVIIPQTEIELKSIQIVFDFTTWEV